VDLAAVPLEADARAEATADVDAADPTAGLTEGPETEAAAQTDAHGDGDADAPKRISRTSVVAMKSVIITGAAGRSISALPSAPPSGDPQWPAPLKTAPVDTDDDSGEVELVVEAADADATSEIAAEAEARSALLPAEGAEFDADVSTEITIENVAEDADDDAPALETPDEDEDDEDDDVAGDDILEMEDLEEVPPSVPPSSAPAVPPTNGGASTVAASPPSTTPNSPPLAPGAPKRKPWFDDFFSDDYLRTVRAPTPKEVARECDAILAMLKLDPGAIILDVGCGLGMHAIELTMRGYIVIGLDLSLPMLSRAADEAQDRGIKINFLHADMREMVFEGGFDAVLCWGTTFGYFDDEGNRSVVERFYSALKPGGRLLIDVVNRDHVIQSQPNLVWFEGDGCICMEETDFNYYASRLNVKRNVILDNGRQHDRHYSIRLYALHEMGQLLQTQGFRVVEVTGRYATPGVFFGAQSPRMTVLAERRQSARDTPPPSLPSVPPPPPPASGSNASGNGSNASNGNGNGNGKPSDRGDAAKADSDSDAQAPD
jgi:SAM-dependent methyltransferase